MVESHVPPPVTSWWAASTPMPAWTSAGVCRFTARHGYNCIYNEGQWENAMEAERAQGMIDKIAEECIAVRLRMLNRVITNIYDHALRPLDLKVSQMNILVPAASMGTARPFAVCEFLQLDVSTLSRNVDRMNVRGWLEVVPDKDGRAQPVRLTPQGRKLLEKAVPAWREAQQQVKKVLGNGFVEQLNQAMKRVRKAGAAS